MRKYVFTLTTLTTKEEADFSRFFRQTEKRSSYQRNFTRRCGTPECLFNRPEFGAPDAHLPSLPPSRLPSSFSKERLELAGTRRAFPCTWAVGAMRDWVLGLQLGNSPTLPSRSRSLDAEAAERSEPRRFRLPSRPVIRMERQPWRRTNPSATAVLLLLLLLLF